MKKTLLIKLILVTLTLTMMLSCFIACDKTEEPAADGKETSQNAGNNGDKTPPAAPTDSKDMNDMLAEINAWKAEDFEETSEKTEYIKVAVKGYGDIIIRLRTDVAPSNATGIQWLIPYKFYDGLTFHRIDEAGYIQGGCPKGDGTGVSGISQRGEFADNGFENPLKHVRGVVSMFRFDDQPNSGSCQFLILTKDCPQFDGNRSAMGYVVAGMDVVDAIAAAEATDGKPAEKIVMKKVCFVKMK
jgi:peptidyl-prolyl cis-trans isomerase B (cyclophilin B)